MPPNSLSCLNVGNFLRKNSAKITRKCYDMLTPTDDNSVFSVLYRSIARFYIQARAKIWLISFQENDQRTWDYTQWNHLFITRQSRLSISTLWHFQKIKVLSNLPLDWKSLASSTFTDLFFDRSLFQALPSVHLLNLSVFFVLRSRWLTLCHVSSYISRLIDM